MSKPKINPWKEGAIKTSYALNDAGYQVNPVARAYINGELSGSTDPTEQLIIEIKLKLEALEELMREYIERKA